MDKLPELLTLFLLVVGGLSTAVTGLLVCIFWILKITSPSKNILVGTFQLSAGFFLIGIIFFALHVEKIWAFSRNGKFGAFTRDDMPFFFWLFLGAYALIAYFQLKNGWSRINQQNLTNHSSGTPNGAP